MPRRHSITPRTSPSSNIAHTRCEHFVLSFHTSEASRPHFPPITRIAVMISGIALIVSFVSVVWERFHNYNRFKFSTIVPLVRIELSSIQVIEVVSVVWVVSIVPIAWTLFETTGTIIRKPGHSVLHFPNINRFATTKWYCNKNIHSFFLLGTAYNHCITESRCLTYLWLSVNTPAKQFLRHPLGCRSLLAMHWTFLISCLLQYFFFLYISSIWVVFC